MAAALEVGDYRQVTQLLRQWQNSDPTNPALRLYAALLQEQTNRLEAAEKSYLKLLKHSPSGKIMSQARAGLGRIKQRQKVQKVEELAQAKQVIGGGELAILAVAAPAPADRPQAIAGLAQVFNLDLYTAGLKLPPSGFRIYRLGPWGEVSYYAKRLKQAHTPALTAKVSDIKALQTFQIGYFKALMPQPTVVCKNAAGQLGTLSFDWAEVRQRVSGQLPIFEQVVDLGAWGKTVHKEKVQDYAQVVDFHLPGRQIVLRVCDRFYQYQKGIALTEQNELNSRIRWNRLLTQFDQATSAPHHSDFTRFGKGALEFISLLPPISPYLDIDRRAPSYWDQAFHLYSSFCYLAGPPTPNFDGSAFGG